MAAGKITAVETLESAKIVEGFQLINAEAIKVLETFNKLKLAGANIKTPKQGTAAITAQNNAYEKGIGIIKARNQLGKQLEAAINKERLATSAANKELIKKRTETNLANKQIKDQAVLSSELVSLYARESKRLTILRDRYKSLNLAKIQGNKLTKAQVAELRRLDSQVKRLDTSLKKADAAAGQFNRNVGNYPKGLRLAAGALRGFLGAFGFTSGIFLFARAMQDAFSRVREFDQAQANLSAILGRSRDDIALLTKQAKDLGATTAFTATQVSALQLELAKLGFDDKQILAATLGVENLAIATGVDAARAAKLAGAALRGFNLDASESNRVAAALAVSTTKSASSFETLEVALPKVSAIAKSFGFSIEDTTALLGGLQNAGFEASIAGTSLRQIFLQLADSNGKLAQRLGGGASSFDELIEQFKKVESEGISLGEAFNLTNARSVAAFKTFLQGADDLKVLRDSIVDVEDELDQLAETKLDSLEGDVKLLNSAWEGLILTIEDGNGSIAKFIRNQTQGITQLITSFTELEKAQSEVFNITEREESFFGNLSSSIPILNLINALRGTKTEFEELTDIQREFNRANQNISANGLETLRSEYSRLNTFLSESNDLTLSQRELYREQVKTIEDAIISKQLERETLEETAIAYGFNEEELGNYADEIRLYTDTDLQQFIDKNIELKGSLEDVNKAITEANDGRRTLAEIDKEIKTQKEALNESTKEEASTILDKIDVLKKEREAFERSSKSKKAEKIIIDGTIAAYENLIKKEKEFINEKAKTTEEIKDAETAIENYNKAIKNLKTGRVEVEKLTEAMEGLIGETTIGNTERLTKAINGLFKASGGEAALARKEIEDFYNAYREIGGLDGLEGIEDFELGASGVIPDSIQGGTDTSDIATTLGYQLDYDAFIDNEKAKTRAAEEQAEIRKGIATSVAGFLQESYGLDFDNFISILNDKEFADLESKEKTQLISQASLESLSSINQTLLNGTLDRLDAELEANRAQLDKVLDDEFATEEEKKKARAKFNRQEAEIKKKQFDANQKAAIAQTAINTAVAIIQAYAQLGPVGGTIAAVLIGALAGVQIANIKKQKPPQFFRGKDEANNYEGLATWNEHRPEVNVDKDGNVVFGRNKNELRYVSREDIIHKSIPDFQNAMKDPSSTTFQRVNNTLANDHRKRTQMVVMQQSTKLDTGDFKKMFREEFARYANRPIQNKVVIKQERTGYAL